MRAPRLKASGWAAAGSVIVLVVVWAGATVYTALKQRADEKRITRIEKVIEGIGVGRPVKVHRQQHAGAGAPAPGRTAEHGEASPSHDGGPAPVFDHSGEGEAVKAAHGKDGSSGPGEPPSSPEGHGGLGAPEQAGGQGGEPPAAEPSPQEALTTTGELVESTTSSATEVLEELGRVPCWLSASC